MMTSSPIWTAVSGEESVLFDLQRPIRRSNARREETALLAEAEACIRANQYKTAIELLKPIKADAIARRFLLECYVAEGHAFDISNETWPPSSSVETIAVANSLWELKEFAKLRELLGMSLVADSVDPSVKHIRERSAAKLENG